MIGSLSMPQVSWNLLRAIVRSYDDPDKMGRVKVEYPWLHETSSPVPSEWARVSLPYASEGHGLWMLPDVGDEVLVYCELGDLDHPIVIGSLYSPKRKPPTFGRPGDGNADTKNSVNGLKTRSGHMLYFDDSSGEERIEVKHASGTSVLLEKDKITIQTGSKITLEASDKITIGKAQTIELGEGASEALVKGQTFSQLFNAHTHPVGSSSSGPPATPMTPDMLSQRVKTV